MRAPVTIRTPSLRIGEVARQSGLSVDTLLGLISRRVLEVSLAADHSWGARRGAWSGRARQGRPGRPQRDPNSGLELERLSLSDRLRSEHRKPVMPATPRPLATPTLVLIAGTTPACSPIEAGVE